MNAALSTGYWPTAVSPESMTAEVPSRIALATSLASARVGSGLRDHRLEHLRRRDRRLPVLERAEDDPLLDERHGRGADLDAEVAARDHDRVGGADDRVQLVERLGLLDLGDDVGLRVGGVQELAQPAAVGGRAHERERDVVDAERERELEVGEVLLRHRGDGDGHARDVDALVGADRAADHDQRPEALAVGVLDGQAHEPVVDQDLVPGLEHLGEDGGHHRQVAGSARALAGDVHRVALDEDPRSVEVADADLRPLEVGDQRERPAGPLLRLAHEPRTLAVLLVGAV